MSVFAAILQAEGAWNTMSNPAVWDTGYGHGRQTPSGNFVNPVVADTLGAYFACKRVIAEDIMALPRKVMKVGTKGDSDPQPFHPTQQFLSGRWNPNMAAITGFQTLQDWALGWGNGYAEIEWDQKKKTFKHAWPIHPSRCEVKIDDDGEMYYKVYNDNGTAVEIHPQDMLHIRGMGDQYQGYSIARLGADAIGAAIGAQTFAGAFWANGTSVNGVLTHPGELDPEAKDNLRRHWVETYGGSKNVGKVAVLEEGVKYERMGIPPNEAQFLETRYFDKEEMCTWFRVNPNKIQVWNKANYNTFEAANIDHAGFTILPWVKRWEEEINYKLFLPSEQALYYAEFNMRGMLRGDLAAQTEHLRAMFNIGVYSQNDIRRLLGENSIGTEGDVYYVALNIGPSEITSKGEFLTSKSGKGRPGSDTGGSNDAEDTSQYLRNAAQILAPTLDAFCKKEQKARANAQKKHAGDDVAFSMWLAEFQQVTDSQLIAALQPQIMAIVDMRDGPMLATRMLSIESALKLAVAEMPALAGEKDAEIRAVHIISATIGA
jgi:HK97 family phage portal protein